MVSARKQQKYGPWQTENSSKIILDRHLCLNCNGKSFNSKIP